MELKDSFWEFYRYLVSDEVESIRRKGTGDCSYLDMIYLDLVFFNDGCTPSFISESLGISKSAVAVRIKRLERDGYLARRVNENDRRSYFLTLTEKSYEYYAPLREMIDRFDRNLRYEFSEDQLELCVRMLKCLMKS